MDTRDKRVYHFVLVSNEMYALGLLRFIIYFTVGESETHLIFITFKQCTYKSGFN